MKIRSLVASVTIALPVIASAQSEAVSVLRYPAPDGYWREVYFRAVQASADAAQELALSQCGGERRRLQAGSVLPRRLRCELATSGQFAAAQRAATAQLAATTRRDAVAASE